MGKNESVFVVLLTCHHFYFVAHSLACTFAISSSYNWALETLCLCPSFSFSFSLYFQEVTVKWGKSITIKIGHVDANIVLLPLGNLLRRVFFSRLKCVAKYFVSFSFSPLSISLLSVSIYYCCWKNKKSVFVLGKYKLNGIHIFHAHSHFLCDSFCVVATFIYFQLFLTCSSQNLYSSQPVLRKNFLFFHAQNWEHLNSTIIVSLTSKCKCTVNSPWAIFVRFSSPA